MTTQSVRAGSASADSASRRRARWLRRPSRRIAGMVVAGVALPLALLGATSAPAHAKAKAESGTSPPASLLSAHVGAAGSGNRGIVGPTPHGYLLVSELHVRLTTTVPSPPHQATTAPVRPGPVAQPITSVARPTPVVRASTPSAHYLGDFVVTCYDDQGLTKSGVPAGMSTVAVDPSVIPLGTTIYIQGVGSRVAQDTGGAIIGNRLDLWEPSYATCVNWGVQSRQVYIEG